MNTRTILRKLRLDRSSRDIVIGILIAGLIATNLLIHEVPLRLDLSRGRAYSLSSSSAKILKDLKVPVEIAYFANSDLPSRYVPVRTDISDLLSEYTQASSKIVVKRLDPKADEKALSEAQKYGIPPLQFSTLSDDQYSTSTGYLGLGIKIGEQYASVPSIDPQTLEYSITSAIYKLATKDQKKIGIIGGGPDLTAYGQPPGESLSTIQQIIGQQATVEQVDPAKLDGSYRPVIVLDGTTTPLTSEAVSSLDRYIDAGGAVIAMTDVISVSQDLTAASASALLKPLLAKRGVRIDQSLVLSAQSELVNFGGSQGQQLVTSYPYWVRTNVFNPDAPYAANLGSLTFPWVSPLTLTKVPGITQREIVRSTPQSWVTTAYTDLKPESIARPDAKDLKTHILMAYTRDDKTKGELVVIPSSKFIQDGFIGQNGNIELILNLVNDFAASGALTGIRSRAPQILPLPTLTSSQRDVYKWGSVLLLPLLLSGYAVYTLSKRK